MASNLSTLGSSFSSPILSKVKTENMSFAIRCIIDSYNYINHDLSDPRTRHYILILNPFVMITFGIVYYKFVKEWGPRFMKNREPFKLERAMICYNLIQIVWCFYVAINLMLRAWKLNYGLFCQPVNFDDTPEQLEMNLLSKQYYFLKIFDLTDTIFFVLRKKQNQVSFLHIYHHLIMILLGFVGNKYIPVAHGVLFGVVNSLVHVCMYTYYLITCINSEYKKSIWWKKHLTQIQMVQFVLFIFHFSWPLLNPNCDYPKWACTLLVTQNAFMLYMFSDFYVKEYIKKNQE